MTCAAGAVVKSSRGPGNRVEQDERLRSSFGEAAAVYAELEVCLLENGTGDELARRGLPRPACRDHGHAQAAISASGQVADGCLGQCALQHLPVPQYP